MAREPAWTLPEAMVVLSVFALLAAQMWRGGAESLALQRLRTASQRLTGGLEEGRWAALRQGRPCGLRLAPTGWESPRDSSLPPCLGVSPASAQASKWEMGSCSCPNLPDPVRFSANGLVLDGGTVWLRSSQTSLVRCVVVSLPLGVTRVGREGPSGCEAEEP